MGLPQPNAEELSVQTHNECIRSGHFGLGHKDAGICRRDRNVVILYDFYVSFLQDRLGVLIHIVTPGVVQHEGNDRFEEHHARLYSILKEPFFVAMSNTLKHREVIKLKDLLADDNRYLHGELRRLSGDEIIGTNFGLKHVMFKVQQVAGLDSPVLLSGETGVGKDVIANAIH